MNNHFNNQFNNDNRGGQGGNQQFMQNIRDTTPHNFIQKSDQNMYGQANYNNYNQNQQSGYQRPYQNYGVSSNERPPVVSQGYCCCSIM